MSIDVEYAIKQDIRNNPVVREIDMAQRRELRRMLVVVGLVVGMLLFTVWQHFQLVKGGKQVEGLRDRLQAAETLNRKLRLERERLLAPQALEPRAIRDLRMRAPAPTEIVILEHSGPAAPPRAIVAGGR